MTAGIAGEFLHIDASQTLDAEISTSRFRPARRGGDPLCSDSRPGVVVLDVPCPTIGYVRPRRERAHHFCGAGPVEEAWPAP